MNIAIVLAALTAVSTFAGGALALKAKDRLHLVLGLSAGLLLGLVAFKVSSDLGLVVFVALLVHAFSDGLNTVSFMIKSGLWGKKSFGLLGVDALARISGAALGSTLVLSDNVIAIYLAAFSGIVIYLATSHILPEAHSRHSSRLTMVATISGVLIMWGLVAYLHSGDAHNHGAGQEIHQEDKHDHEEEHDHAEKHDHAENE